MVKNIKNVQDVDIMGKWNVLVGWSILEKMYLP